MLHFFALKTKLLRLDPDLVVLAIDHTDARDDALIYLPLLYTDEAGEPTGVRSRIDAAKTSLLRGMRTQLPLTNVDYWIAWSADSLYVTRFVFEKRVFQYLEKYQSLLELPSLGKWELLPRSMRSNSRRW